MAVVAKEAVAATMVEGKVYHRGVAFLLGTTGRQAKEMAGG